MQWWDNNLFITYKTDRSNKRKLIKFLALKNTIFKFEYCDILKIDNQYFSHKFLIHFAFLFVPILSNVIIVTKYIHTVIFQFIEK